MTNDSDSAIERGIDPFGPQGTVRALSQLVRALLLCGGRGLILDCAGLLVRDAAQCMLLLGDPVDPDCRPFLAWVDQGWIPEQAQVRTWGMVSIGYPNVALELARNDEDGAAAALHAANFACYTMVRRGSGLEVAERLAVPRDVAISAYSVIGAERFDTYVVRKEVEAWIYLEREP